MTRRTPATKEEPEIVEIRKIRKKIWRQAGGTLDAVVRMLQQRQRERLEAAKTTSVKKRSATPKRKRAA